MTEVSSFADGSETLNNRLINNKLLIPALLCFWILPFATISAPDEWRMSRFGTVPILPPTIIKAIKLIGRLSATTILCMALAYVWKYPKRHHALIKLAPLIIFAVLAIISTLWSPVKSVSLQQSASFAMLIMLATYIGIVWKSDYDTERLLKHLSLSIFTLSLFLLALRFGIPRSGALTKEAAGLLHSTNAGASGGLGILLTFTARLLYRTSWTRWWIPIIAIESIMLLIAGNRLSVLVTGLTTIIVILRGMHRGHLAFGVLAIVLSIGLYFVADPKLSVFKSSAKQITDVAKQGQTKKQLGSFSGRSEMWEKMWKSYQKAPLIGHGYGVTTAKGRIYVWGEWGNWSAHNLVLHTLVTVGAVGLVIMLSGLIAIAMEAFPATSLNDQSEKSAMILVFIAVWYTAWGLLNESFVGPLMPESVVFAAIIGVGAGIGSQRNLLRAAQRNDQRLVHRGNG